MPSFGLGYGLHKHQGGGKKKSASPDEQVKRSLQEIHRTGWRLFIDKESGVEVRPADPGSQPKLPTPPDPFFAALADVVERLATRKGNFDVAAEWFDRIGYEIEIVDYSGDDVWRLRLHDRRLTTITYNNLKQDGDNLTVDLKGNVLPGVTRPHIPEWRDE